MAIGKMVDDTECLAEWNGLLGLFHKAQRSNDKKALLSIKSEAANNKLLTYRQSDGISARCDNALNGTYGNTKTASQLNVGK